MASTICGDVTSLPRSAVDFELFRRELSAALSYTERTEGGRPPFDPVLMFKILVIQALTIFPMNAPNFSSLTGCRLCGSKLIAQIAQPLQPIKAAAQGSRRALDGQTNRARMAQRRQSIWQSRSLAIRTMSRSIAVSALSADGRPQRLPTRAVADTAYRSAAADRQKFLAGRVGKR